jgi:hypothetical protein
MTRYPRCVRGVQSPDSSSNSLLQLEVLDTSIADMEEYASMTELFMKVTLILARVSPDRELTCIMVGSRWIYPGFQVFYFPPGLRSLVMFPEPNSLTRESSLKEVEPLRDQIYRIKGPESVRSLVSLYYFSANCHVGAYRRGRPPERSLV